MMFGRFRRGGEVVGFAFSGGGSRGASQVGALKALAEARIEPQIVAGTSAGAVNAAFLAMFPGELDRLEGIWMALRTRDIFPGNRVRTIFNLARRGHIHLADAWEAFLRSHAGDGTFEECRTPCSVVAVRLSDGQRVVFNSGPIVPAVMASTAIPGLFPPYRIGDEVYVDGGVLEYLPLPTILQQGASVVYAMDSSWYGNRTGFRGSVVDRTSRISATAAVQRMTRLSAARGVTVHHLRPELPDFDDSRDFRFTAELVAAGYRHAQQYLEGSSGSLEVPTKVG